jgi:putative DNA primase/helicase
MSLFEGDNCDQNILEKICTPQELSGLLNLALEALKKILKQKGFSYSQTTKDTRLDYIAKSDPEGGFVQENLENDAEGEIAKKDLFDLFAATPGS